MDAFEPLEAVGVSITTIKAKLKRAPLIYYSLGLFLTTVVAAMIPAVRAARTQVLKAVHQS